MIRDSLSALDHDNEDAYAATLRPTRKSWSRWKRIHHAGAGGIAGRKARIDHGARDAGLFRDRIRFEIITTVIPNVSTEVEPSARDVAAVVDVVRDEGVPVIFSDIHLSDVIVNAIASETGVAVIGLHSDSLGAADGPADLPRLHALQCNCDCRGAERRLALSSASVTLCFSAR